MYPLPIAPTVFPFTATLASVTRCYLRTTMEQYMPSVLRHLDEIYPHWTIDEENAYMQEHFRSYPNLSIGKYMHVILNNSQYRKYVMLLNTTLINRGLK